MADNFISGVGANVNMDGVDYSFTSWKLPIKSGTKIFFAFGSDFQRTLAGAIGAAVVLEGYYNQGNMPLVIGTLVMLTLTWDTGITLVVQARVGDIDFGAKIDQTEEPGGTVTVTLPTDGPFTVSYN